MDAKLLKAGVYNASHFAEKYKEAVMLLSLMTVLTLILLYLHVVAYQTGRLDYFIYLLAGGMFQFYLLGVRERQLESYKTWSYWWSSMWSSAVGNPTQGGKLLAELELTPEDKKKLTDSSKKMNELLEKYGYLFAYPIPIVAYLSVLYGTYGVGRFAWSRYPGGQIPRV
jgi:hypothetical protein